MASVAITGLGTFLGRQLVQRLSALDPPVTLLGVDLEPPLRRLPNFHFQPIDLTEPGAVGVLAEVLRAEEVEVLAHLAFRSFPSGDGAGDRALETAGTRHVLEACAQAGVGRVLVESSTMAYGARPENPNFLEESSALRGHARVQPVQNRVEVERFLVGWRERNPAVQCTVLRRCWVMGPTFFDPVVEFFDADAVPTVLGYDPLLQFIHEEDLVHAFQRAILEPHPGVFNVVGRGVVPLSTLLARAGKWRLPIPRPWLYPAAWVASQRAKGALPSGFFDYLRYLWVADGTNGWREFGEPVYSTGEAWSAFVGSRRMRHHA